MKPTTDQQVTPLAYTVEDALAASGIGRTKFYEEIAAGRLKARKVGTRTLVLAPDLAAWLEALPLAESIAA